MRVSLLEMLPSFKKINSLISRLRLSRKTDKSYLFLTRLLGYKTSRPELFELAFTHRSFLQKSRNRTLSNERLEYLGDAALGLVVSEQLYIAYPNKDEGFLTRARARIVCRPNLNLISHRLHLDKHINSGELKDNADNIYGNALEALIGAIYIDRGFKQAEQFIIKYIIQSNEHLKRLAEADNDFKSRLLEWGQANNAHIVFNQLADNYNSISDSHNFICQVIIDAKPITQAAGKTKKEAQQTAAKKALGVVKKQKNAT